MDETRGTSEVIDGPEATTFAFSEFPTKISMFNPWRSLTFRAIQLGLEAQNVIALRMMRLAAGGATARAEARRRLPTRLRPGLKCRLWPR
jgi:hypothetical protein